MNLGWTTHGLDGLEIRVHQGTLFVVPATDTIPGHTGCQNALWKRKTTHNQSDDRAGLWSDIVSLSEAR